MDTEERVARHYGARGDLERLVLEAVAAEGKDIDRLRASDLSRADEFHLGWHPATVELAKSLKLAADMHVLDIGSGLGGPARHFAEAAGCRVAGIDLTEEFVRAAEALTKRVGLAGRVTFRLGSALALPFPDTTFDAATLIHVGMNIADKAKLFSEARRVLKPGGRFAVYDVMRVAEGELPYPMPWAQTAETSFVERPGTYRDLLEAAGFAVESQEGRRDFVLRLVAKMREAGAARGAPVTASIITTPERVANVTRALEAGIIEPTQIIARAV